LRTQRRPPRRPRARRPRHLRHCTVGHGRRPAQPTDRSRPAAQAQRCRTSLPGHRPSGAGVWFRAALVAVRRPAAWVLVPVPAHALGLQPSAAPRRPPGLPGLHDVAANTPSWGDQLRWWTPPRCRARPPGRRSSARRWPGMPATATARATTSTCGACGCRCWPPRTGWRSPGVWPLPSSGSARSSRPWWSMSAPGCVQGWSSWATRAWPGVTSSNWSPATARGCCDLTAPTNRAGTARWAASGSGSRAPSTHPQRPARVGTPRRPDPGRRLGLRRAGAAGPRRMHLVELADQRS
jgi:hypothetical protein